MNNSKYELLTAKTPKNPTRSSKRFLHRSSYSCSYPTSSIQILLHIPVLYPLLRKQKMFKLIIVGVLVVVVVAVGGEGGGGFDNSSPPTISADRGQVEVHR